MVPVRGLSVENINLFNRFLDVSSCCSDGSHSIDAVRLKFTMRICCDWVAGFLNVYWSGFQFWHQQWFVSVPNASYSCLPTPMFYNSNFDVFINTNFRKCQSSQLQWCCWIFRQSSRYGRGMNSNIVWSLCQWCRDYIQVCTNAIGDFTGRLTKIWTGCAQDYWIVEWMSMFGFRILGM